MKKTVLFILAIIIPVIVSAAPPLQLTHKSTQRAAPNADTIVVELDLGVLLQSVTERSKRAVVIDLPPDKTITIVPERIANKRSEKDFSWFGGNKAENATAILSVRNGILAGTISLNHETYKLRLHGNSYLIQKLDPKGKMPYEEGELPLEEPIKLMQPDSYRSGEPFIRYKPQSGELPLSRKAMRVTTSTVDILFLYSAGFAAQEGASTAATLQNIFDVAAAAYVNSQTNVVLNLVHSEQLPASSTLNDTSDLNSTLNAMPADGYITFTRQKYGADAVALFGVYNEANTSCGLGVVPTSTSSSHTNAFSVIRVGSVYVAPYTYYCSDLSFAHELGHNFGCFHDRDHVSSGVPMFPYGYGYDVFDKFATIMSYDSPEISYFSNPYINDTTYGLPIGVDENGTYPANNARQIRERASEMANNSDEISEALESGDTRTNYYIAGVLETKTDRDGYLIALGGATVIDGSSTIYGNWAYYVHLYDSEHNLVISSDADINTTLANDYYRLVISICNIATGSCYLTDNNGYTMNITTQYKGGVSPSLILYLLN